MAKYIIHYYINTQSQLRSYLNEINHDDLVYSQQLLCELNANNTASKWQDYLFKINHQNGKSIKIEITHDNTLLARFALCNHSRYRSKVWAMMGGLGIPPELPYCVIHNSFLVNQDIKTMIQAIAWAWLLNKENNQ